MAQIPKEIEVKLDPKQWLEVLAIIEALRDRIERLEETVDVMRYGGCKDSE